MNLPNSVVSDFAKLVSPDNQKGEQILYGYVTSVSVDEDDERVAMVRFDGSAVDTPASLSMDAEQGDRVSVLVKNHEATVNGNITSPASARTATKYMRFTNDGLVIGSLSAAGNPDGNYILITDSAYYIKDSSDATLLSVSSDGTRVVGPDGILKASFLSDGTTLYSGGLLRLLVNSNGVTIYDPTGTKTMAEFLSSGIKIYNENGVITSKFDATGAVLLNPTSNDNDGVRIYNGSQANAANLLASFVASGIRLHALATSGGTTVNRTLAEFLASGISLYNQNGYRMFLADTSGIHLYDDTQTLSAEFLSTGLKLYGQRDGVKIYNSPADATPLSEFGASGVKLHALVETQIGGVIQTTNRVLAEFLNTGVKLYNQSGILQTKMDTAGLKLYNKDGEVTASFEDKGCVLYGRNDGIRIYDSPTVANVHTRQLLASFKSDGVRLHGINSNNVSVMLAEFLASGITLNRSDGTPMVKIGNGEIALTDSNGNTASSLGWTALGLADGLAQLIYDDADDVLDITCHGSVTINGNTPANQIDVTNLSSTVSSLNTAVASKASQSSVTSLNTTVTQLQSKLDTLVMQLATMVTTGTASVTNTATAAHLTVFRVTPSNIPSGYTLTGVRDIKITKNGNESIHYSLNQFAVSGTALQAHVYNDTNSNESLTVEFEWFAIRTSFSLS